MDRNRGSQFRKWDMHLHSLYTYLNNSYKVNEANKEESFDKFLAELKENNIEVIGLTNYYNFTDNDFCLRKELEKNGIIVFFNLELRLENGNSKDETCDIHVIFDNSLQDKDIKDFLASMKAKVVNKKLNSISTEEDLKKAVVSFDDLVHCLNDTSLNLQDHYLIGILGRGKGSSRLSAVFEDIADRCDFFIHSSDKQENLDNDKEYLNHQGKPLLQSSDAHSFEKIGKKFSWVKADKTFEGLKQILFEPTDRVCLTQEKPQLEKDELVIDKIGYMNREIYLSENLNSIIGGRSTGKSTLLNSIAQKLNKEIDERSFVFNEMREFKIFWRDQIENYERQIEYIPQEYMFKLANDEKSLNSLVNKIIKMKKLDEKIEEYKVKCKRLQTDIQALLDIYFDKIEKLTELQKPEAEESATKKRLDEYKDQRQEILTKNNFTDGEKGKFQKQIKEKEKFDNKIKINKEQKEILNKLEFQEFKFIDNNNKLDKETEKELVLFSEHVNQEIKQKFSIKVSAIVSELDKEITTCCNNIKTIEASDVYKKGLDISKTNTEVTKLDELIKNENSVLEKIKAYEKQKWGFEKEVEDKQDEIIKKYKTYRCIREDLEKEFNISENDLEIRLEFKQKDLYPEFPYINGQGNAKGKFIERLQSNFDIEIEKIFDQQDLRFNNNKTEKDLIENFFTTHFYDYNFKIIYQNDEFKQMSPGKKAFVILKLILEFSESRIPVLIDQPEDSLDNRAIYNELTRYIKETKRNRQIIIVTHNPNVVVGSDCENIIVANQHSDNSKNKNNVKFDYVNGSLENSFIKDSPFILEKQGIREHIFEILEGGKEAFEKREQKYNVKTIRL